MTETLPEDLHPFETALEGIQNGGQWSRKAWEAPVRLMQENNEPPKLFVPGIGGFTGEPTQADKDATDWYQSG